MKKLWVFSLILIVALMGTACSSKSEDNEDSKTEDETQSLLDVAEDLSEIAASVSEEWPEEADRLGIPEPKAGKVGQSGTINEVTSVGYTEFTREDLDDYFKELTESGFAPGLVYPGGQIWNYVKNVDTGSVDITMTLDINTGEFSMVIVNSDQKAEITEASTLTLDDIRSRVPENFKLFEDADVITVTDNGFMITVEYKNVKDDQVESYVESLETAGFEKE